MEYDSYFNNFNINYLINKEIILHIRLSIQQLKSKYASAVIFKESTDTSITIDINNSFFNRFFYKLNNKKILLFLKEVNSINENIFISNKDNTFYFKHIGNEKAKIVKNIDNF
tara:strand:+ start:7912 stop:8250 length:339 start_codon:yes stop_codon:yes gene_type:complete